MGEVGREQSTFTKRGGSNNTFSNQSEKERKRLEQEGGEGGGVGMNEIQKKENLHRNFFGALLPMINLKEFQKFQKEPFSQFV